MEEKQDDEKVIISRKMLKALELSNQKMEMQLKEEKLKFKESTKYSLIYKSFFTGYIQQIYTNEELLTEIFNQNAKLMEEYTLLRKKIDKFWRKPWYIRVFKSIFKTTKFS